ncbi:hypothetical protein WJX82_009192 [Trebouxia sp. C0006]
MPALAVSTNVSKSQSNQEDVAKQLSQQICKAFPKNEAKMLVTFRQDATLIFGGNTEPAALAELYYAAGGFGHDIHTKLTKLIQSILQETLGVSPGRCHCVFQEQSHQNWGCGGKVLADMQAS